MAGDAGKMLSGGQRQRISLARAILKDAPIVVLDEATAYADPENEEKMEAAIAELVKGKTLVAVSYTHLDVYKRQVYYRTTSRMARLPSMKRNC